MDASEHTVLLYFPPPFLKLAKKLLYDNSIYLDLSANPKVFTLPAQIPNQPDCTETRCRMQRNVFVFKGVIELFYKQLDVKTQLCLHGKREQCRCV